MSWIHSLNNFNKDKMYHTWIGYRNVMYASCYGSGTRRVTTLRANIDSQVAVANPMSSTNIIDVDDELNVYRT